MKSKSEHMLSDEQVEKFQAIYRKSFGKEISYEDVLDRGIKLVRAMKIIYQPITQEDYDDLQKRRALRHSKTLKK